MTRILDILKFTRSDDYRISNFLLNIEDVMVDSREILENSVFLARVGKRFDGGKFAGQAQKNGAILIICEKWIEGCECDQIIVEDLPSIENDIANLVYDDPSHKIDIFSVTGTNGKTSVVFMLKQMLEKLGVPSGRTGTIDYDTINARYNSVNTFPQGSLYIRLLKETIESGGVAFVSEVSSHAISLGRTDKILFNGVIFTNLSRDHLDFHGSMEEYFYVKRSFVKRCLFNGGYVAINNDCEYGRRLLKEVGGRDNVITFGKQVSSDIWIKKIDRKDNRSFVSFIINEKNYNFDTELIGEFNIYNLLSCIALLSLYSFDMDSLLKTIPSILPPPGRMEYIKKGNIDIFIDYAHTPDALGNALRCLKKDFEKVLVVFGCGGDRDRGKRADMGKKAEEYADYAIITNDNPRSEEPEKIAYDIIEGMPKKYYTLILNRREAIQKAIDMCLEQGYTLLIAGKGHEEYQEVKGEKVFLSDREIVKNYEF